MFAKLFVASFIGLSSLAAASAANAAPPRPELREVRQDARIARGVATGQLTGGETLLLLGEQAHIDAMERRARADGHVGPVERARLERAQDHASHRIYALKHNRRAR